MASRRAIRAKARSRDLPLGSDLPDERADLHRNRDQPSTPPGDTVSVRAIPTIARLDTRQIIELDRLRQRPAPAHRSSVLNVLKSSCRWRTTFLAEYSNPETSSLTTYTPLLPRRPTIGSEPLLQYWFSHAPKCVPYVGSLRSSPSSSIRRAGACAGIGVVQIRTVLRDEPFQTGSEIDRAPLRPGGSPRARTVAARNGASHRGGTRKAPFRTHAVQHQPTALSCDGELVGRTGGRRAPRYRGSSLQNEHATQSVPRSSLQVSFDQCMPNRDSYVVYSFMRLALRQLRERKGDIIIIFAHLFQLSARPFRRRVQGILFSASRPSPHAFWRNQHASACTTSTLVYGIVDTSDP